MIHSPSRRSLIIACAALVLTAGACKNPDFFDYDGDGVVDADDCAPEDAEVFPGADEDCDDGIDNDCDGDASEDHTTQTHARVWSWRDDGGADPAAHMTVMFIIG